MVVQSDHAEDFLGDKKNNNFTDSFLASSRDTEDSDSLETNGERRKRKLSLWIVYITVFIQCMAASIVVPPLWPYLQKLDSEASKEWFGGIVAANPLGQLIFSPLIGWWCNRLNSIRIPSFVCLGIFILTNVWYAILPLHQSNVKYCMFAARFLIGASSGSLAACRTYLSKGTLLSERTTSISIFSLAQSLGFILGPIAQVQLNRLGEEGYHLVGELTLSMYTSSGWIIAFVGLLNLFLYLPYCFRESNIAEEEVIAQAKSNEREALDPQKKQTIKWSNFPPDYLGICPVVYGFFIVFFSLSLMETLATPVMIDQFGMDNLRAIETVGIATAISSLLALACFFTIPPLCKRFDERIVLIGLGLIPLVLGRIFFFPFGGPVAPMRIEGCFRETSQLEVITSRSSCDGIPGASWKVVQHGCPQEQSWCFQLPILNGIAIGIGYAICTIGYPYSVVLLQTIFSKMIGPRPQGVWMGALTGISSLARVLGPFLVTYIYTQFGTIATSAVATGLMLLGFLAIVLVYKRLVPIQIPTNF